MKNVFIGMSDIFTSWIFFAQPKLVKLQSKEYRRPKCFRKFLTQKIINSENKTTQKVLYIYFSRLVGGGGGWEISSGGHNQ